MTGDRDAITDVLLDYCEAVDEGRIDDLMRVFAPDCRFDRGFGTVFEGREALRAFFSSGLALYSATSHHLSNVRVRIAGQGRAFATSYVYAFHRYAANGETSELWARYRDVLVCGENGWQIAERRIRAAAEDRIPAPPGRATLFEPIERADPAA